MIDEKEEVKRKLKQLKNLGIAREAVAEHHGYSPGYFNQMLGTSGKIPPGFISQFNQFYEHHMKIAPVNASLPATTKKGRVDSRNTLYIQRKEDSAFTDYARRMAAADFFHEVEGDAMHPLFKRGDGLLLIEIEKDVIVGGEAYVLELNTGLASVRYIKFDETDPQKLLLVSYNKSAGDTMVTRADVTRLFKIVLKISK